MQLEVAGFLAAMNSRGINLRLASTQ